MTIRRIEKSLNIRTWRVSWFIVGIFESRKPVYNRQHRVLQVGILGWGVCIITRNYYVKGA